MHPNSLQTGSTWDTGNTGAGTAGAQLQRRCIDTCSAPAPALRPRANALVGKTERKGEEAEQRAQSSWRPEAGEAKGQTKHPTTFTHTLSTGTNNFFNKKQVNVWEEKSHRFQILRITGQTDKASWHVSISPEQHAVLTPS